MPLPLVEIPEQPSTDDIDEEILEIFMEECEEVLEEIRTSYAVWKRSPSDKDALQTLRRAFHTLKGSGRLVGAMAIGELGWSFENMLNRVIDGGLSSSQPMFKLIDQVEDMIPPLTRQFKHSAPPFYEAVLLLSQARHLTDTKGAEIGEFISAAEAGLPTVEGGEAEAALAPAEISTSETEEAEEETLGATAELLEPAKDEEIEEALDTEAEPLPAAAETAPEPVADAEALLGDMEEEEEEPVDPVLLEIFAKESATHLKSLKQFILECKKHLPCIPQESGYRVLHTLNGSSRSMGLQRVAALAATMEKYVRACIDHRLPVYKEQLTLIIESGKMLHALLSSQEAAFDQKLYDKLLAQWQKIHRHLPSEEEFEAAQEVEEDLETENELPEPASFFAEFAEEATPEEEEPEPALAGEAAPPPPAPPVAPASAAGEEMSETADEFMEIFLEEAEEILETSQSLVGRWMSSPNNMPLLKELQRELHTLKGGSRMVGISAMGDLSHQLESVLTRIVEGNVQSNPRFQELVQESLDELAAMLEAVREGVSLEPATDLIQQISLAIDGEAAAGTRPPAKKAKEKSAAAREAPVSKEEAEIEGTVPKEESEAGEAEERVRVRASLIDKLTNLAGEMSILRAHMEQQQGAVKNNLGEMEETVMRLRDLLRRLDIETEVQIISHFGEQQHTHSLAQDGTESVHDNEDNEDFDPLEMDRFSGMQQLSRSLMETVNDLQSIQENLKNLNRDSEKLLIQQTRVGTELQDGIIGTRMVPFSQVSPRLQRIARLTARELKKQVNFTIGDDSIEFERTVLNRVVAPLEHMLRNAIGHGVEVPERRKKAGKPPVAEIHIELFHEGAELVLKMSDDGAGINVDAVRKKAESKGMLQSGQEISDQELIQFILEPAFSTAEKVTQVSGRGVGMDIVSSEIKQLGGALGIESERGKGTIFEMRIPTSLTIAKALLVHLGEETMAVPLANVDAVMRVPREQLIPSDGQDVHYYHYMEQPYRVMHLADMLGFQRASVDMSLLPILLIRSGDKRLALLVDGIEGSKEVVVKAVGTQLGAIRWLAGATILGDGRVVIILDILTLMRTSLVQKSKVEPVSVPEEISAALAEAHAKVPTVMVVDDSITVRKVTARLLKRQGMEVITAKDGLDAVAQLQEVVPDIMLLDVEMPRMDGFELATQIRNDDNLKHLPIIMITSRTGVKHRERASKIGINRHLGKPFNENELIENIKQLLEEERSNA